MVKRRGPVEGYLEGIKEEKGVISPASRGEPIPSLNKI